MPGSLLRHGYALFWGTAQNPSDASLFNFWRPPDKSPRTKCDLFADHQTPFHAGVSWQWIAWS